MQQKIQARLNAKKQTNKQKYWNAAWHVYTRGTEKQHLRGLKRSNLLSLPTRKATFTPCECAFAVRIGHGGVAIVSARLPVRLITCQSPRSCYLHHLSLSLSLSLSLFLSAYPPSWIFTPLKKTENQCLCNLNLCPEPTRLSHVDLMTFEICSEPTGSHLLRAEPRGCVLESEPGAERSPAH